MPLGHGIAGGVALSGLPLAVTAAGSDPRWAKDIGERVGYVPESIVCVPLFYEDRVIGALELLDKDRRAVVHARPTCTRSACSRTRRRSRSSSRGRGSARARCSRPRSGARRRDDAAAAGSAS